MELDEVFGLIREVPDFPAPGVLFRDLAPVFADAAAFCALTDALAAELDPAVDVLVAIEARGFLLGAALGTALGLGVVALRKPGKSPVVAASVAYALEYGTASLELPAGLLRPGQVAQVVDDVLATGGTAAAAGELVTGAGARLAGLSVVIELTALGGRATLADCPVSALLQV